METIETPKPINSEIHQVQRITWIGVIINIALSGIKFLVGYLGASQAVIADAVHSLSDMVTDFAIIIGVRLWAAPPDECHPYGHKRIEALITIFIGMVLAGAACALAYNAIVTIDDVHSHNITMVAIWGPLLSIIFKELLFRWTRSIGTRIKSRALVANAWHHRSDTLSSVPALIAVGVSAAKPEWSIIDHIAAILIAVLIIKVSLEIMGPALAEITDKGASAEAHETIKIIAMGVQGVSDVHGIRTRRFGDDLHVDIHVLVNPHLSVHDGHKISQQVKYTLIKDGPNIVDVLVHLEPDLSG
ncbi:MAG: cation diffusion facilitator family transporter [Thermodesulfobacteriota bacterium]|nr:cation diffusion facilitator family transporter [Thermodesulfobacteriota bacterium]